MTELVIWAQSVCRSTMALYREVKRLAGVPVTVVVRKNERGEWARQLRESQGQGSGEFVDVVDFGSVDCDPVEVGDAAGGSAGSRQVPRRKRACRLGRFVYNG